MHCSSDDALFAEIVPRTLVLSSTSSGGDDEVDDAPASSFFTVVHNAALTQAGTPDEEALAADTVREVINTVLRGSSNEAMEVDADSTSLPSARRPTSSPGVPRVAAEHSAKDLVTSRAAASAIRASPETPPGEPSGSLRSISINPSGNSLHAALRDGDESRIRHLVEVANHAVAPADVSLAASLGAGPDVMALLREYCVASPSASHPHSKHASAGSTAASPPTVVLTDRERAGSRSARGGAPSPPSHLAANHINNGAMADISSSGARRGSGGVSVVLLTPSAPNVHPTVMHDAAAAASAANLPGFHGGAHYGAIVVPATAGHHHHHPAAAAAGAGPSVVEILNHTADGTASAASSAHASDAPVESAGLVDGPEHHLNTPLRWAIHRRDSAAVRHLVEIACYEVTPEDVGAAITAGMSSELCNLLGEYVRPAHHGHHHQPLPPAQQQQGEVAVATPAAAAP